MMKLEYSDKGVPYIDLEEWGRLAFSSITSHPTKGYRFICYNRSYKERVRVKKKVKGEIVERYIKAEQRDSTTFDMNFQRKTGKQTKGFQRGTIPPRLGDWLRKTFKKYITEDKYFPYDKIEDLERYVNRYGDIDKITSKPQRKRKVKNGKRNKKRSNKRHSKTSKSVKTD